MAYQKYRDRQKRYYCKALCWWGTDSLTADFAYTEAGRKKMVAWMNKHVEEGWRVTVHVGKAQK